MPFVIVRNNIVKVKADAIVNSANPLPVYGFPKDKALRIAIDTITAFIQAQL